MVQYTYLCQQCQELFKLEATQGPSKKGEARCPNCGSINIKGLPSWAPIGFTECSPIWEYECQQCKNVFKLPIPSSPSQEKEIKCSKCGSGYIHRLTSTGGLPMYCG